jgi:hypothetical protein
MKLTTHLHLVAEVKNVWSYTSAPPICLHGADMKNFNFHVMKIRLGFSFSHVYNMAFLPEPLTMWHENQACWRITGDYVNRRITLKCATGPKNVKWTKPCRTRESLCLYRWHSENVTLYHVRVGCTASVLEKLDAGIFRVKCSAEGSSRFLQNC